MGKIKLIEICLHDKKKSLKTERIYVHKGVWRTGQFLDSCGVPTQGKLKNSKHVQEKKTNWHEKSIRCKRRNQIVAKNIIVISFSLIVEKSYYSKIYNCKAIWFSDMNSHVR